MAEPLLCELSYSHRPFTSRAPQSLPAPLFWPCPCLLDDSMLAYVFHENAPESPEFVFLAYTPLLTPHQRVSITPLEWLQTCHGRNCIKDDLVTFCTSLFLFWVSDSTLSHSVLPARSLGLLCPSTPSAYPPTYSSQISLHLFVSIATTSSHHLLSMELFQRPLNWSSLIYSHLSSLALYASEWKIWTHPPTDSPLKHILKAKSFIWPERPCMASPSPYSLQDCLCYSLLSLLLTCYWAFAYAFISAWNVHLPYHPYPVNLYFYWDRNTNMIFLRKMFATPKRALMSWFSYHS